MYKIKCENCRFSDPPFDTPIFCIAQYNMKCSKVYGSEKCIDWAKPKLNCRALDCYIWHDYATWDNIECLVTS